jgi:flagellar motor switch protein FliG
MSRAVKPAVKDDIRQLSGAERSAVLLLALGEEHAARLWEMLDDEEIREISQIMSNLGSVSAGAVE